MSGKTKGGKGTQSKAEKSNETEELKKAKDKIVSLEGKVKKLRDLEKNEKNLQDEVRRLTVRVLSLEHDFNYEEVRRRLPESEDRDGIFATENARLVNEVKRLEEELEKSKGSTRQKSELKRKDEQILSLTNNQLANITKLETTNADLTEKLREKSNKVADLEKENNWLKETLENNNKTKLEIPNLDFTQKLEEKSIKVDHLEFKIWDLKEEREELFEIVKQLETKIMELKEERQRTTKHIKELEEENEALKISLSKLAGVQMLTNNPNIADLSDSNRPTKLAEQYSELYDNEWANAYEGLESQRKSETEIVTKLREKMLGIYHYCSIHAKQHGETLNAMVMGAEGKTIKDNDIPPAKLRQLKDVRRVFAPEMAETVCKKFMENGPKDTDVINAYVRRCVELCWFICVHDPPLVIDTRSHNGAFNSDIFKVYYKSGKTLDYVVWPPLYLHEGGPILCKGVAQGK